MCMSLYRGRKKKKIRVSFYTERGEREIVMLSAVLFNALSARCFACRSQSRLTEKKKSSSSRHDTNPFSNQTGFQYCCQSSTGDNQKYIDDINNENNNFRSLKNHFYNSNIHLKKKSFHTIKIGGVRDYLCSKKKRQSFCEEI